MQHSWSAIAHLSYGTSWSPLLSSLSSTFVLSLLLCKWMVGWSYLISDRGRTSNPLIEQHSFFTNCSSHFSRFQPVWWWNRAGAFVTPGRFHEKLERKHTEILQWNVHKPSFFIFELGGSWKSTLYVHICDCTHTHIIKYSKIVATDASDFKMINDRCCMSTRYSYKYRAAVIQMPE